METNTAHLEPAKENTEEPLPLTPCSALLARIEGMDVRKVAASTQYGMGLVIVVEGAKHLINGIAYRNDEMAHDDRGSLAEEANAIFRQNVQAMASADTQTPQANGQP
jgi:hypothetical protein